MANVNLWQKHGKLTYKICYCDWILLCTMNFTSTLWAYAMENDRFWFVFGLRLQINSISLSVCVCLYVFSCKVAFSFKLRSKVCPQELNIWFRFWLYSIHTYTCMHRYMFFHFTKLQISNLNSLDELSVCETLTCGENRIIEYKICILGSNTTTNNAVVRSMCVCVG